MLSRNSLVFLPEFLIKIILVEGGRNVVNLEAISFYSFLSPF